MSSTLIANSVYKSYMDNGITTQILKGISMRFDQGDTYAIKGVSGSGKSTLLHILGGLDSPTKGEVLLDGNNVSKLSEQKRSKLLGFVFQFHYLINELTVLENIMLAGKLANMSLKEVEIRASELISFLGLENRVNYNPYKLSGGEQQRVSIARALFNKPTFLLADEPTGNLDKKNAELVVDLLLKCRDQWEMGLIVCSHDQYVCDNMQNRMVLGAGLLGSCKSEEKR